MSNKRICVVVGGTGGIGKYIVKAFSENGYDVIFTYYRNKEVANAIENEYGVNSYCVDSSSEKDVKNFSNEIEANYGRIDALVYATGIFEDSLIDNMELESWRRVIDTNLTGIFLYAKHFLRLLRKSESGRFVAIGSVMGESGIYGSCSYGATKAGLIGLIKSIALENAKYGITANVVSFGYIDAGMTEQLSEKVLESAMKKIPMKKLGDPYDAARVVVDVCSEHMGYVSGQVIRNNGLLYV